MSNTKKNKHKPKQNNSIQSAGAKKKTAFDYITAFDCNPISYEHLLIHMLFHKYFCDAQDY